MYAYIRGTVEEVLADSVILDNNGIGYRIFVPASAVSEISLGEERKLYTHFAVREDAIQLFGFLSKDDLEVYRLLLGVSGVGPKGALGILGVMDADDLRFAVLTDDAAGIAKAPGIGKKTAQKVILELKDRLNPEDVLSDRSDAGNSKTKDIQGSPSSDAVLALVALGYTTPEATKAVRRAAEESPEADTEVLIKAALRELF